VSSDDRVEAEFKMNVDEEEEESKAEDKDGEDVGKDWPLHDISRALHVSELL
jgi:hypothetical protein